MPEMHLPWLPIDFTLDAAVSIAKSEVSSFGISADTSTQGIQGAPGFAVRFLGDPAKRACAKRNRFEDSASLFADGVS